MIYYIKTYGYTLEEFLAKNAKFIGTSKEDLSDVLTYSALKTNAEQGRFLACSIQNLDWYIGIIFANKDSVKEIFQKFYDNTKIWFWLDLSVIKKYSCISDDAINQLSCHNL